MAERPAPSGTTRGDEAAAKLRERRRGYHIGTSDVARGVAAMVGLGLLGWYGATHWLPDGHHDVASAGPSTPHDTHNTPDHPTPNDGNNIVDIPHAPGDHAGYFTMEQEVNGQWYDTITLDVFTQHIKETQWGHDLTDAQAQQIFDMCHAKHVSANFLLATAQVFPSQYNNLGSQLSGSHNPADAYPIHNADGSTSWYVKFAPGFDGKVASVDSFTSIVANIAGKHSEPTVQADEGDYYGTHDGGVSLGELETRLEANMHQSNLESQALHPGDVIPVEHNPGNAGQTSEPLNPQAEIFASLFASAA